MAGDFNKPVVSDNYTAVLQSIRDTMIDLAKCLDGTGTANIPTNAIRWNSTSNKFEKYNGTVWNALTSQMIQDVSSVGGKVPGLAAGNLLYLDGSAKVPLANMYTGAGSGLNADLLDSVDISNIFRNLGTILLANTDTSTGFGAYQRTLSGSTDTLLSFDMGGTPGAIQLSFVSDGQIQWRNKTNSTTWQTWRPLVMAGLIPTFYSFDVTGKQTNTTTYAGIQFTNTEQLNLASPYSGIVKIKSTHASFNQPHLIIEKAANSLSLYNSTNLALRATSGASADIEFFANSGTYTSPVTPFSAAVQGKFKAHVIPGIGSGGVESTLNEGGGAYCVDSCNETNTGFDRLLTIFQFRKGGEIYSAGRGLFVVPTTNMGQDTQILCRSAFQNAILKAESTATNGHAILDLNGKLVGTSGGQYRYLANGQNGSLYLLNMAASVPGQFVQEILPANSTFKSATCFYQYNDYAKGSIRLGDSTHNMILAGALKTFDFSTTGSTKITINGAYVVYAGESAKIGMTNGGSVAITAIGTEFFLYLTGSVANYTVNLPASPLNNQTVKIVTSGAITTNLTIGTTDGSTVVGQPGTLPAHQYVYYQFYTPDNAWIRLE